jgi:hypothetical protein
MTRWSKILSARTDEALAKVSDAHARDWRQTARTESARGNHAGAREARREATAHEQRAADRRSRS